MSEAIHAQKEQTQREEQREERAAHAQRETMATQREAPQRETQQRDAQQREAPRDAQREAQRETPQDSQRQTPREAQRENVSPHASQTASQNTPQNASQQRQSSRLEDEWQAVQFEFVDDPQAAVRKADDLVTKAIEELNSRHRTLSQQWKGDGKHETEDLRLALHRYRELFKSLVAVK